MSKIIRWNGHEIEYDPKNLIPLLARVAQITREEKPTILTNEHMRPGMEVEMHLRKYGHLPSLGCCYRS